ncbi:helix-turn-helix transcriptional regulator [Nonomuraea bangladeshensis]|uniref:Helix-turn-helix transcriptional regulator n=1 Tax=Nonomuraea bangladeshensis TaxID=404385 RepID=A0ABV3HFY8_9ACTN
MGQTSSPATRQPIPSRNPRPGSASSLDGMTPVRERGITSSPRTRGETADARRPGRTSRPTGRPVATPRNAHRPHKSRHRPPLRLVRQYAGISQTRISVAVGFSQGKVSEYMQGKAQVTALDVFERIADGLALPNPPACSSASPRGSSPASRTRPHPSRHGMEHQQAAFLTWNK